VGAGAGFHITSYLTEVPIGTPLIFVIVDVLESFEQELNTMKIRLNKMIFFILIWILDLSN
jgi:hypothetical protein